MSLPLPTLDDRRFEELFEEARALLPRLAPEWTDHNTSDPGITLLELGTWLVETQLHRLDQVPERQLEAWARLLGLVRREAVPAQVTLWPSSSKLVRTGLVAAGSSVRLIERADLPYEIARDRYLTRAELKSVTSRVGGVEDEHLEANQRERTRFLALGRRPAVGDELVLRFDPWFDEPHAHLWFELADEDLAAPAPEGLGDPAPRPSAVLQWAWSRDGSSWSPLDVLEDETRHLTRSGALVFRVPRGLKDGCALRACLCSGSYEIPPELWCVDLNVLEARQVGRADCDLGEGTGEVDQALWLPAPTPDERAPELWLPGAFARGFGVERVRDWKGFCEALSASKKDLSRYVASALGACPEAPTPKERFELARMLQELLGAGALLRAATEDERLASALLGRGRTPSRLDLALLQECAHESLARLFADELASDRPIVRGWPWHLVDSFDTSGPGDKHFMLDRVQRRVHFGNGINGDVPARGERLRLERLYTCEGASGNVKAGLHWRVALDQQGLAAAFENFRPARGGQDRESVADLMARLRELLRQPKRAITGRDVEALARGTPGLRVARAHATFGASPERPHESDVAGDVLVTVVPCARTEDHARPPDPSEGFRRSVECHLERHRLVGDRIRVRAVRYVEVSVECRLVLVEGADAARAKERVAQELDRCLAPLSVDGAGAGKWELGRDVAGWEVRAALDELPEVDYVESLRLAVPDGVWTERISIQAGELPRPGTHRIEVVPARVERTWLEGGAG